MKIRRSERGVALIITLIMLSVVTVTAVIFLGVSRRERAAVAVTSDQMTAKLMAESAFARAEGEIVARMLMSNNKLNYDFAVSTNFLKIDGFDTSDDDWEQFDASNVNYRTTSGGILNQYQQAVNIGNLQFDPRPPVYIERTDVDPDDPPLDFRYFLNFNRNIISRGHKGKRFSSARFDPTGLLPEIGEYRQRLKVDDVPLFTRQVGDPQWIGVLEYPNQPHSATNRFIGRYAYLVLPEGKSLDLNAIYNRGKGNGPFVRNQGVGPWEMNLGAFLNDLNFNVWVNPNDASTDARSLLDHRGINTNTFGDFFAGEPILQQDEPILQQDLGRDYVDFFADGPYLGKESWLPGDNDSPTNIYWGSDLPHAYYDVQELFNLTNVANVSRRRAFISRLRQGGRRQSTYDRYTVYRLLSQIGVDSEVDEQATLMTLASLDDGPPARKQRKIPKLHLNYANLSTNDNQTIKQPTQFEEWDPSMFFLEAGRRLLQTNIINTDLIKEGQLKEIPGPNFFLVGDTYVNRDFSITNIQVWPRNESGRHEYTANVHQLLQMAANIGDVVINTDNANRQPVRFFGTDDQPFPLVFRPQFGRRVVNGTDVIYINNYVEVTNNASDEIGKPWRDLDVHRNTLIPGRTNDYNVYGVPWVIAAKKGLPNFNEFGVLTSLEVTRKLEINKGFPNAPVSNWRTNQMMLLSVSNLIGVELWNSYDQPYPRPLKIDVRVEWTSLSITNELGLLFITNKYGNEVENLPPPPIMTSTNIPANTWSNRQFQLPLFTNYTVIPNAVYNHMRMALREIPVRKGNNAEDPFIHSDNGFPVGRIGITMTNRVQCFMYDTDYNRIIDFVNLDGLVSGVDITGETIGEMNSRGQSSESAQYWRTNRLGGAASVFVPTEGVLNQILASLGEIPVSRQMWRSYVGRGAGRDREEAQDLFRAFLGFPPRYLSANDLSDAWRRLRDPRKSFRRQVPFTPSVRKSIYQTWQANDPLVHYMVEDLQDNEQLAAQTLFITPGQQVRAQDLHNLGTPEAPGQINRRYRPWPSIQGATPASLYNMAHKDPLIRRSDDWQFPTNPSNKFKFPNIGWLGRVHRGTPWQTIYLKAYLGSDGNGRMLTVNDLPDVNQSRLPEEGMAYPFQTLALNANTGDEAVTVDTVADIEKIKNMEIDRLKNWFRWSGSLGTHPTNDWKILEQFTTALNDNASRGLLSVNQAGLAAWSAVLSGVTVQTNFNTNLISRRDFDGLMPAEYSWRTIQPAGLAGMPGAAARSPLFQIVNGTNGINATRARFADGRFRHLGDILATPALTVQSPFLQWSNATVSEAGLDDFAVERIPQQVLSLLKADEPRVTVYAYGQALRPADQSLRREPEPPRLFNICTNYQITGEFAAKRVIRFEGELSNLKALVESEIVIPAD
ncbi:MAG: hypothetical protein M2R45_03060 [Verrucomicrobia subdivision 3 bacterium]|nr:hypothetical protein [Limisphaerales bacterium]MCS1416546.1 hypothetical protein [Limisphaerales bacterium]